jgi:hypothetical protein
VAGALAAVDVEDLAGHEVGERKVDDSLDNNSEVGGSQNRSSFFGRAIGV